MKHYKSSVRAKSAQSWSASGAETWAWRHTTAEKITQIVANLKDTRVDSVKSLLQENIFKD